MPQTPSDNRISVPEWIVAISWKTLAKVCVYAILAWQYASIFWLGQNRLAIDDAWVYGLIDRPWVYRQLVPLTTRFLIWITGLRVDIALVTVVAVSAVLAMLACGRLLREFGEQDVDRREVIFALVLFVFRVKDASIYDFATVATFAWALLLLYQQKFRLYYLMFLLACANRETSFLLIVFFAYHFYYKLPRKQYVWNIAVQILIFVSVRLVMLYAFQENPGVDAQFNLLNNVREFSGSPLGAGIVVVILSLAIWLVARRWRDTPQFLRDVILSFAPILFVLWIVFGRAFELRVFVELFPALFVILARTRTGQFSREAEKEARLP